MNHPHQQTGTRVTRPEKRTPTPLQQTDSPHHRLYRIPHAIFQATQTGNLGAFPKPLRPDLLLPRFSSHHLIYNAPTSHQPLHTLKQPPSFSTPPNHLRTRAPENILHQSSIRPTFPRNHPPHTTSSSPHLSLPHAHKKRMTPKDHPFILEISSDYFSTSSMSFAIPSLDISPWYSSLILPSLVIVM